MAFQDKLKELMSERNMKSVELARATELSEAAISDYLKGKKEPRGRQSIAIAKALGVSLDTLWETNLQEKIPLKTKKSPELTEVNSGDLHPLLKIYNELNADGQERLMEYAEDLAEMPKYKKCPDISQKAIG